LVIIDVNADAIKILFSVRFNFTSSQTYKP